MSRKAISMRKIKELLRLKGLGLGQRQIARSMNLSVGVVNKYIHGLEKAELTESIVKDWTEAQIQKQLQLAIKDPDSEAQGFLSPDYDKMHEELQKKGVTLKLLHEEYKAMEQTQPPSLPLYAYSQFCTLYRIWKKKQSLTLRQVHEPGTAFIDYAGPKVTLTDSATKETTEASIFIMSLGLSQYTYVEATLDQSLPHWIGSHTRAFEFFGGVPCLLVPDNTKTGVTKACYYDPDLNQTYAEMATHYNTVIMPTRPYKPRDKGKVENAVLLTERWILACFRHRQFNNLVELNQAIKELLDKLNTKPFQKQPGNRLEKFKDQDQHSLKPLPCKSYEVATFKKLKVPNDYHLVVNNHAYSVPHTVVGEKVDVRTTAHTLEIFHQGTRIASHARQIKPGTTTVQAHQPASHVYHQNWTEEIALSWAEDIGSSTQRFLKERLNSHHHRQQQYRYFLGLSKLAQQFGVKKLEAVCKKALLYGVTRYQVLLQLLKSDFDKVPLPKKSPEAKPIAHENIRGATYYSTEKGNKS